MPCATDSDGKHAGLFLLVLLLAQLPAACPEQDEDIPHNEVKNWALMFGTDLWEYGRELTRMKDLQKKYHDENIDVKRKDGLLLIREMATEVKNMMDFKMSAVMRIMDSAEQAALTPQTDSGQPFKFFNAEKLNVFGPDGRPIEGTREMMLHSNPHFDHLPVNISLSTVLIPQIINLKDLEVMNSVQWSEHLDPLFVNNYESDPSLSWQFFGSSTGFLRRYPGMAWPPQDISSTWQRAKTGKNVYDFRSSIWYISAATSPKDIVILVDNSGSMGGRRASIARATVEAILDTLSDNDFVNVFKFSDTTEETVGCFKDMLVQANNENKRWLKESLRTLRPENIANFTSALVTAFEILHKYNRTGNGCQCNQAIMLITDGPPANFREIFKMYNWPHRPVRVFTYLTGKDSSSAEEMHWMACENKGYYTRVSSEDKAKEMVLHYIEVMARSMVMYQNDHPIQWSPAYVGGMADTLTNDRRGQLMTSVTTPVFDRRNHSVRVANLLGVVGTDVSVDEIKKLVPPYKLGVNGYSFVVSNNGHVLYHPDLRPLQYNEQYEDTLEPSYCSVDLTEVELIEIENGPRENHSALLDLRHDMIDQKEGESELGVKIHYDNMRRVTTRRNKYFYNPIEGTPFSLGLALPEGYGMYELVAEQEIKHSPKNVVEFFQGKNWRVHPDWVYCEYSSGSAAEQRFDNAEDRVLHFLQRSRRPGWKWMSLRPRSPMQRAEHHHVSAKQDKDAYFCDKTLLQSLVLDAMITQEVEKHNSHTEGKNPIARLLVLLQSRGHKMFGLSLSFVATRSGLLRWTEHLKSEPPQTFSETNMRSLDETWYKRAVDQHAIEPESFVYSVPFNVGSLSKPLVTATHAVFVEHRGHRAAAAVVGLQYQHATLAAHFLNITATCSGSSTCKKTCANHELDCYILDNNGFIIISENPEHTGRFFGQIDGTIMDSLVQDRIYKKVPVYDYQGACTNSKSTYGADASTISPFYPMRMFFKWLAQIYIVWLNFIQMAYGSAIPLAQDEDNYHIDTTDYEYNTGDEITDDNLNPPFPDNPPFIAPPIESDPLDGVDLGQFGFRTCDKKVDLYILQPDRLNTTGKSNPLKGKLTNCHVTGCERPFSVQKVPYSNLILLVVDTLCPCGSKQLSISPQELVYDNGNGGCLHKPKDSLYRRRPPKCINYHPEEIEIHICGASNSLTENMLLLVVLLFCPRLFMS